MFPDAKQQHGVCCYAGALQILQMAEVLQSDAACQPRMQSAGQEQWSCTGVWPYTHAYQCMAHRLIEPSKAKAA